MKRFTVIAAAALAVTVSACDPTLPFRALNEEQPIAKITFVGDATGGSIMSAEPSTFAIVLFDKAGNSIDTTGRTIEWKSADENIVTVAGTTASATFTGKKVGTANVTATVKGIVASLAVTVTPGTPAKIVAVSGAGQLGIVGENFLTPFVAQVADVNDNVVGAGATVNWQVGSGPVSAATTDDKGQSTSNYKPSATGPATVAAALPAGSAKASFAVIVTTMELGFVAEPPGTAVNDVVVTPAPVIQLQFATDHSAYKRAGVTVTASTSTGTGPVLSGNTAVTDANGKATFSKLLMTGVAGDVTLQFATTSPAGSITATKPTTLLAGVAVKLALSSAPSPSSISGQAMAQAAVVQIRDISNNDVKQDGVVVTATAVSGTVTLGSTTATTDANGQATFAALAVSGNPGDSYTLRFSSGTLTPADASPSVLTGPATKLTLTQAPTSTLCGASLTSMVARLQDAGNRNVFQQGVSVTLTTSTNSTLAGTTTRTTDVNGQVTFSSIALSATAVGTYTLSFTAATLPALSTSVALSTNSAAALKIVTQPSATVVDGAALAASPVVDVVDICGLVVAQSGTVITAATTSTTSPTFAPATATTNASGRATFAGLTMTGKIGDYTLRFTAPSLSAVNATAVTTLTIGGVSKLALTTPATFTTPSASLFSPQPVVQVQDIGGNDLTTAAAANRVVTLTANGSQIGTATTDATGKATFTSVKITGVAGSYALIYSTPSLTSAQSTVTLGGAGTASAMAVSVQPSSAGLNAQTLMVTPQVQLRDAGGVAVSLAGVTVTASAGTAAVTGGSAITDATGLATFGTLAVNGTANTAYTLSFAATGLPSVTSAGTVTIATPMTKNTLVSGISGSTTLPRYYGVAASPSGTLTVTLTGAANVELYGLFNAVPTAATALASCNVPGVNTNKNCSVTFAVSGQFFVLLNGTASYSGATLLINW